MRQSRGSRSQNRHVNDKKNIYIRLYSNELLEIEIRACAQTNLKRSFTFSKYINYFFLLFLKVYIFYLKIASIKRKAHS